MTLGICWFQPQQWESVKALFTDSESFGATYEDWHATTQDAITRLKMAGGNPIKVEVDLNELSDWCRAKGQPVNNNSCSQFIRVVMERNK